MLISIRSGVEDRRYTSKQKHKVILERDKCYDESRADVPLESAGTGTGSGCGGGFKLGSQGQGP